MLVWRLGVLLHLCVLWLLSFFIFKLIIGRAYGPRSQRFYRYLMLCTAQSTR
jgi:hypothetical protein